MHMYRTWRRLKVCMLNSQLIIIKNNAYQCKYNYKRVYITPYPAGTESD